VASLLLLIGCSGSSLDDANNSGKYQSQSESPTYVEREHGGISQICFYHSEEGMLYAEFIIDFVENKVWKYYSAPGYGCSYRDKSAKNEGYDYIRSLSDEETGVFMRESARLGLTKWEREYREVGLLDGHEWGIVIHFFDRTRQSARGYNEYPETWDKMREAFLELTGEDVLMRKAVDLSSYSKR